MKTKYLPILYTALLLIVAVLSFQKIDAVSEIPLDMVGINERCKRIEQSLLECVVASETFDPEKICDLEETYQCHIILCSEADYQSQCVKEIQAGAAMMDVLLDGKLLAKICFEKEGQNLLQQKRMLQMILMVTLSIIWMLGIGMYLYFYRLHIIPFQELRDFAKEVARGNLDVPLHMRKENYFGAFTESFDIMRTELRHAKEREYQANISKKELVAELSHDIKTPIATIKAACEILQLKEDNPIVMQKVKLIETKATMIDQLVSNLFHATLEELEMLKVEPTEEWSTCIEEMLEHLKGYGQLEICDQIPRCLILVDKLRMNQVLDNIIHNAYKYAKTKVFVSYFEQEEGIRIRIRDEGNGVAEDELTKITEKFYRGKNAQGESGSGLGLYLSKLFMEQMQGQLEVYNEQGLVVELYIRKI
ncbi:MAG: HAMP domain-containing histidine kinase [Eubacterium sp.]|nr:HAMP domain-containing histidine kinase [Eubacterium sp.]